MAEFIHTTGAPKIDRRATVVPALTSTTIERPPASLASLVPMGCPKGVPPHEWRRAIAARIEALADQMNALVSVLDWMDGDSDLEEAGDELDVSWPEGFRPFDTSLSEDAEDDDTDEDDGDKEPTLGSVGYKPWDSQAFWASGVAGDHEREEENEHGGDILDVGHL